MKARCGARRRLGPLAVIAGLVGAALACGEPAEQQPRNAVLIVIDTLRADRTSVYGGPRPTTPVLARMARDGVVFDEVVTYATWTLPSMAAMASGRYPSRRVFDGRLRLSLVEALRAAGFRTAAFTEGGFVSRQYGFDLGFDTFEEQTFPVPMLPKVAGLDAAPDSASLSGQEIARTFANARRWLEAHGDAPFFLLVHTYEPHTPYLRRTFVGEQHPAGLEETFGVFEAGLAKLGQLELDREQLAYIRSLYDGGVAEADRHVGVLLEDLDRLGLADTTLVVVTSDHGEDLGDRDPPAPGNHGHTLFDEQALVPLVMRDPTFPYRGTRVAAQVRTVDVLPTILDRLGVARPEGLTGRSLVPLVTGDERAGRPAFLRSVKPFTDPPTRLSGLRTGSRKLVVKETGRGPGRPPRIALYDLDADPGEREDVASLRPEERQALLDRYHAWRNQVDAASPPTIDAERAGEQAERLRALGYIE